MNLRLIIGGFISLFFFLGCVKNNPDPAWIEIEEFVLEKNPLLNNNEGNVSRHAFRHAWLYVDEQYIGVFELPCKIPILKTGKHSVRVYPTINNNGVSLTKKQYLFVDSYLEMVELSANKSVKIQPKTRYVNGTNFWIEDFEGSTIKLSDGTDSQTSMLTELEGTNTVGRVILTPNQTRWSAYVSLELSDQKPFIFPLGSQVYLEFECKNTHPIKTFCSWQTQAGQTGMQVHYGSAKSEEWKKMYIDFTEIVAYSGGLGFWFGFIGDLPPGDTQATLLLDNIKIVYRQV